MSHPDPRQAPTLLVDTLRNFANLMQTELQLAKAEIANNVSRAGAGIAMMVVAAILALTGLNVLAGALVAYIATTGLSAGTAALIVGGGVLIVAVILVLVGKSRLSAAALEPTRTLNNLQRDAATVKGATNV
ncbi:phage holin family protein [uncultured Sulfitobacter sp.]|uniref:phage holin family protein n=1 Tax=uncultured Sulfitobacter sp. TaxID=191468 RepID=UPI00262517DF|nr:phage holin family protein [uncultured Sulfitobacter sp.]